LVNNIENAAQKMREVDDHKEENQKMVEYAKEFDCMDLGVDVTRQCLHHYDLESID